MIGHSCHVVETKVNPIKRCCTTKSSENGQNKERERYLRTNNNNNKNSNCKENESEREREITKVEIRIIPEIGDRGLGFGKNLDIG